MVKEIDLSSGVDESEINYNGICISNDIK